MEAEGIAERKGYDDNGLVNNKNYPVVSVIIVNFNGGLLLSTAVRSVLSSTVPVKVFISDNGSTDGSLLSLRGLVGINTRLQIIENRRNLGFACACNIVLKQIGSEYVLLLNPDAIIMSDTLARMMETLAAYPEVGMAGCLLRNPDGTEQAGCRRSVPTPWRTLVRVFHLDKLFPNHLRFRNFVLTQQPLPERPVFLEAISGAFMLVRRKALEDVGLLDEKYFLHCEDLDWCMRFRRTGWKILFVPNVEVVHYSGTCSKNRSFFVLWHKHKGMIRFYRKFFRHQYPWPLMLLVMVVVWMRFILLAGRTLFMRKEASPPSNKTITESQNKLTSRPATQVKITKPLSVNSDITPPAIDPMLVVFSTEAKRPSNRLP
jgi:GT2 family glycosyltransferase